MPPRIELERAAARRFMASRHLLSPARGLPPEPASVLRVVERLGSLQFDPLEVAGRNHDLVLAARIEGYRRAWTDEHLYGSRELYETYNKGLSIVPTAELPWHRITWDENRVAHDDAAFVEHGPLVAELLERIRRDGPLSPTDVEPRPAIDWYWRPTNQVRAILEALAEAGILGLARRERNRRVYDLAERLFPAALLEVHPDPREQRRHKLLSRYRGHGLLGRSGSAELWHGVAPGVRRPGKPGIPTRGELLDELVEAGTLLPVAIQGVRGERFILAEELGILEAAVEAGSREAGDTAGTTG
ncbi:MAG: crosslink repair DNA glycosylase YcaQ family protein, partial [Chloroflexota bacterium]